MKFKIVGTGIVFAAFVVFSSYTFRSSPDKDRVLIQLMQQVLNYNHYSPQRIDNSFSAEVFDIYLEKLDYGKRYFTQIDIERMSNYRTQIDDQAMKGTYSFFNLSADIFLQRIQEAENYYQDILSQPFDFSIDEDFEADVENRTYARDKEALYEVWRKLLKYQTLSRLENMIQNQKENIESGDPEIEEKSFETLEAEARDKVKEVWYDAFTRLKKTNKSDLKEIYINSIANRFDPHTGYFAPIDKEAFDIRMSGQYEGIGAQLSPKNGKITVSRIIPGSPCYRLGTLDVGDQVLKVAQGADEPVDVMDMKLDDAVQLIRGKKGTEVRLTVKKISGTIKIIPIIRGQVKLEETYAKSALINTSEDGSENVGYIHLPKFYADFEDSNGRQCATDVANEIQKLKEENVSGIILDLRNNGGGSLADVVKMSGLFIEEGPIVQVKSRERNPYVLRDKDIRVQWDGPLVVLVNSSSASASEILAAAIQDYERGIIIGSNSTFGKGTVQRFVDLDQFIDGDQGIKPLGSMKLTIQKFYRINGGATQLKGVKPDIVLPDNYTYLDWGEKDQDYPMKWDEIDAVSFTPWENPFNSFDQVIAKSEDRVKSNPVFQLIDENARRLEEQRNDLSYSLNLDTYTREEEQLEAESKKYEEIFDQEFGIIANGLSKDIASESNEEQTKNREAWLKNIKKDPYILEAMRVVFDMK